MIDLKQTIEFDIQNSSMEEVLEKRRQLSARRTQTNQDLEALMLQEVAAAKEAYMQHRQGFERVTAEIKEYFGFGRDYEYKKSIEKMGLVSGQLSTIAKNIQKTRNEYRVHIDDTKNQLNDEITLLICNNHWYTDLQQKIAEKKAVLDQQKNDSMRPLATAEAFELQQQLRLYEQDIDTINHENNELAVSIVTRKAELGLYEDTSTKLQSLLGQISNQNAALKNHYELSLAERSIVHNMKGIDSVNIPYMEAAVTVQQHTMLKKDLNRKPLEELSKEFGLFKPEIKQGKQHPEYWHAVLNEVLA